MKRLRILPEIWARTSWPFSSLARNIVPASTAVMRPSTSIGSSIANQSLAKRKHLSFFSANCFRLLVSNPQRTKVQMWIQRLAFRADVDRMDGFQASARPDFGLLHDELTR